MYRTRNPLASFARRSIKLAAGLALITVAASAAGAQAVAADTQAVALETAPSMASRAVTPSTVPTSMMVTQPVAATRSLVAHDETAAAAFRTARALEAGAAVADAGTQKQGKIYMIVGGAAFIAGAVIGKDAGTIIMIGGAGIGIYGLYLYLQ